MLPGAGALPDGVNAALYAAEGDLVNAGLSAAAAVPGIGDGATAAKYAAKYGDEVAAIAKTAGDFCSFRADTAVLTPDGLTPIAAINVGDHVLAYHEGLYTTGTYTVTAVWAHRDPVVVTLLLDDEVIETTPEHPFFVAGRGWTPAGALVAGSTIQQADGTTGVVHAMQMEHRSQVMYNFTVAEAHTYFVGEGSWLVHNACNPVKAGESGRFRDLDARAVVGDGLTPHHMPQAARGFTTRNDGAALVMPEAEHALTRTYGSSGRVTNATESAAGVSFRDTLARDIRDVRKIAGSKYNQGLRGITDYYRQNFPGLMAK